MAFWLVVASTIAWLMFSLIVPFLAATCFISLTETSLRAIVYVSLVCFWIFMVYSITENSELS